MFGPAISRWTPLHFSVAIVFFLVAQVAMLAGVAYPALSLYAPTTLATVHLLTVGWLTVLILGALYQFAPVITAQPSVPGWSVLTSLLLIVLGLGGMEAGFLSLGGVLARWAVWALPVGGALVLCGAVMGTVPVMKTLWRSRPLALSSRFIAAGLAFFFATIGLGLIFALTFSWPGLIPWRGEFTAGLRLHLLAGLVGWFTLTAMGVSYPLLSMFTLAPEERGRVGTAALTLSAGGVAAAWLLGVLQAVNAPIPDAASATALGALALGIAIYLFDMVRLYRARRRQKLELNAVMAIAALAALGASLTVSAVTAAAGNIGKIAGPLGYLFVFGWLSGLALSQLYKIVPFLTWIECYGPLLGKQQVPRVQDLVNEERDRRWFIVYFVAVAIGAACGALGWIAAWRAAIFVHLIATLAIARALLLVRRGVLPRARPTDARGDTRAAPFAVSTRLTSME